MIYVSRSARGNSKKKTNATGYLQKTAGHSCVSHDQPDHKFPPGGSSDQPRRRRRRRRKNKLCWPATVPGFLSGSNTAIPLKVLFFCDSRAGNVTQRVSAVWPLGSVEVFFPLHRRKQCPDVSRKIELEIGVDWFAGRVLDPGAVKGRKGI